MGNKSILKVCVLALGALATSVPAAMAAGISFNGEACLDGTNTCVLDISDNPGAKLTVTRPDKLALDTTDGAFGLGLGFIEGNQGVGVSEFPETLNFKFNRDVTLLGGELSANFASAGFDTDIVVSGGSLDPDTLLFDGQPDTLQIGGTVATSAVFQPVSFTSSIDFESGVTYLLTFSDFGDAAGGNLDGDPSSEAYAQLLSLNVNVTSVPLPPTVWMLLGAIGLLGFRKYRSA